jgi:hypothetical protein
MAQIIVAEISHRVCLGREAANEAPAVLASLNSQRPGTEPRVQSSGTVVGYDAA